VSGRPAVFIGVKHHSDRPDMLSSVAMLRLCPAAFLLGLAPFMLAQQKDSSMTYHAKGTFTVDVHPLTPAPAEGLSRFSIDKQIKGDLDATSKGEMFSGRDPKQGVAGYVAIEVVTGILKGKHGSFALQHTATMDQSGRKMSVVIVPGSGTGELRGISGTFDIQIANGQHSYDLEYALP
jgi:Protein of unknown function (DUF3224)